MQKRGVKMKKIISFLLCIILLISVISCASSCGNSDYDNGKIKIVCTLFPQYDWVRSIVGNSNKIEVSLLIQNGTDPHSYQPTAADILTVTNCDMIIYSGAESDKWIKEALSDDKYDNIVRIALCDIPSIKLHDISSTSGEHSHEKEFGHSHDHGTDSHGVLDEHVWLSLHNAIIATRHISEAICKLDRENEGKYIENSEKYISSLLSLDEKFKFEIEKIDKHDRFIIFADRFPFIYLLSDYHVSFQAAFDGCSADTDADFETVLTLIKEADTHSVSCVAVTESSDKSLANTVINSAKRNDMKIITLNSLQSINKNDIDNGATYISVMRENLENIMLALTK